MRSAGEMLFGYSEGMSALSHGMAFFPSCSFCFFLPSLVISERLWEGLRIPPILLANCPKNPKHGWEGSWELVPFHACSPFKAPRPDPGRRAQTGACAPAPPSTQASLPPVVGRGSWQAPRTLEARLLPRTSWKEVPASLCTSPPRSGRGT